MNELLFSFLATARLPGAFSVTPDEDGALFSVAQWRCGMGDGPAFASRAGHLY